MSTKATEIFIREQTKLVLKFLEHGEIEEARQVILNNKEVLRYNLGLINFVPLIPRIRFSKILPRTNDALKMVIDTGFQIYSKEENIDELLFFAAAKCDPEKLTYCVHQILEKAPAAINQVREGDTALMFLIKYGNVADDMYPVCMKILVVAGVDVNRNDYFSHNPLLFLLDLYIRNAKKQQRVEQIVRNVKECIEMLLATKKIEPSSIKVKSTDKTARDLLQENGFTDCSEQEVKENLTDESVMERQEHQDSKCPEQDPQESQIDMLFKYLLSGKEDAFIKSKKVLQHLDAADGNNTLLQLCCEKNLKKAALFLIQKGADVCKVTERNRKTPLELAARRNYWEIFQALLATNKIEITEELFLTFLRNRPKHIKARYFDEILKYKNLDLNIRSTNGNTPLHYAIIFSSTEAIQVLLQRGASLTVENDSKKCPLDYITAEDLESHLNKCVIPDNYNDIYNGKYELALNYRNLIETNDSRVVSELTIVDKICNSPKLCHLLNHALIASFLNLKWKLVEPLYRKFFVFHMLFYLLTIASFINLNLLNYLGLPLAFIYGVRIYSIFNWNSNKVHEIVDISIATIILLSSFISNNVIRYQLGLTATIFMAFSFHLFWRFSPEFSQFHALLINILTQLISYLFYIFSLIVFFGAAFHIVFLVRNEDNLHETSSYNYITNITMMTPSFYILTIFGVFVAVMVVMTIINSVTYLQQNSENIKNNFQVLGYKNTLIFMQSVEKFYRDRGVIKNPLIFEEVSLTDDGKSKVETETTNKKQKKANRNKNRFLVNFYLNTNKFSVEKLLSVKLTELNVVRIKKIIVG